MIEDYNHSVAATPGAQPSGVVCSTVGGSFEFGLVLYWLNNPPKFLSDAAKVLVEVLKLIKGGARLPKSKITPELDTCNNPLILSRIAVYGCRGRFPVRI